MEYFKIRKDNARTPVLAIHGSASSGRQWQSLIEKAAGDRPFLAIDLPGYGPGGAAELSHDSDRVQGIVNLIQNADAPIDLIGHSFGGAIALAVAAKVPHLIRKAVLYEPMSIPKVNDKNGPFAEFYALKSKFANAAPEKAVELFINFWAGFDHWKNMHPTAKSRMGSQYEVLKSDFEYLLTTDLTADFEKLCCDVTVITGTASPITAHAMAAALGAKLNAVTQISLVGLNHFTPSKGCDFLNATILAQLDDIGEVQLSA